MPWTLTDEGEGLYYEVAGERHPLVFAGGFDGIADVWARPVLGVRAVTS